MNYEQEEKTIRELFRQLRREDERSAPSFADSTAAVNKRQISAARRSLTIAVLRHWRVAAAVAAAILLSGTGWMIFKRDAKTTVPVATVKSEAPAHRTEPEVEATPLPKLPVALPRGRTSRLLHHHQRGKMRPEIALLSQWRSPTEFLLRTPGEQLLKSVPRLNESLIRVNIVETDKNMDQKN